MSDHNSQTPWTDLSQTLIRKLGRTTGKEQFRVLGKAGFTQQCFTKHPLYIVTLHIFT